MGEYKEYFKSFFPNEASKDILRQVFEGYKNTFKFMKEQELQAGPQSNVYSHNRIAHIDSNLLSLNKKHEGLFASTQKIRVGGWKYTLLSFENIRLTASSVISPYTTPRESYFRNKYASSQFSFSANASKDEFEFDQLISIEDGLIYALIVHSPATDDPRYPAFVHIAFPNNNCTGYLDRINLIEEYPTIANAYYNEGVEVIPDRVNAQLKLNIEEQK